MRPLQYDHYLRNVYLKTCNGYAHLNAYNAISVLDTQAKSKGITCASAGNAHGEAYTAKALNLKAVIFMPVTTPLQKVNQVKFFGAENVEIVLTGDTFDDCLKEALVYTDEHHMTFIDPFNNVYTIAGQGTLAKEILLEAKKKRFNLIISLQLLEAEV